MSMKTDPNCHMAGVLPALLHISRFFGIAPLQFRKEGKGWRVRMSQSFTEYGYITVTICNMIFIVIPALQQHVAIFKNLRDFTRYAMWVVVVIMTLITTTAMVITSPRRWQQLLNGLKALDQFNPNLGIEDTPGKRIRMYLYWILAFLLLCIADFVLVQIISPDNSLSWIRNAYGTYFFLYWTIRMDMLQFIFTVFHVWTYFYAISDSLRKVLKEIKFINEQDQVLLGRHSLYKANNMYKMADNDGSTLTDFNKLGSENFPVSTEECKHACRVRQACEAYARACHAVSILDSNYGVSVFLVLATHFYHLVTTPYLFIHNLISDNELSGTVNAILASSNAIWVVMYVLMLTLVIEPCHLIYKEIKTIQRLVSQLLLQTHSIYEPLAVELDQFYKILITVSISYTPLNIVNMSRSLIIGVLGSITTYLMVLVEMN